ncbi:hypothetical protein NDU88_006520 [Pleurodeles waltl]|uniref:Uncharacterized protein n=1 Tax=Pleurodeles waltl TaxID=8319 RepID=A0AAV7PLA1_PLEWA|nr:hypothetical protein NDU88_006520 [Pleurodeles waltl]
MGQVSAVEEQQKSCEKARSAVWPGRWALAAAWEWVCPRGIGLRPGRSPALGGAAASERGEEARWQSPHGRCQNRE